VGLPFSLPSYIANPHKAMKHAVQIECYNLDTECLGAVLVDDQYWLEGHEASSSFFLIPKNADEPIPYSMAQFYADCISFEHDFSALAVPPLDDLAELDIPWNFKPSHRDNQASCRARSLYVEYIRETAQVTNCLSNGLSYKVIFKYDWLEAPTEGYDGHEIVKVSWLRVFSDVSKAIHLYNAALRQADPLSQYLCFYRVVENITHKNGKSWIKDKIGNPSLEYSTPIWCEVCNKWYSLVSPEIRPYIRIDKLLSDKQRINLVEVARANALYQLHQLRSSLDDSNIVHRLYNENRCGIAHGTEIKLHDLGDDFRSILNDLKLIRYLARLAIDENL
jgi:hypothetical protein